eukprot:2184504-Prymnesium_polylepis.1
MRTASGRGGAVQPCARWSGHAPLLLPLAGLRCGRAPGASRDEGQSVEEERGGGGGGRGESGSAATRFRRLAHFRCARARACPRAFAAAVL